MSFEEKFSEGALFANMNQLASLLVVKEKMLRITSVQIECDYMFHLGGLEYKADGYLYKSELLQKQIELKCEFQHLTREQVLKKAKANLKERTMERAAMGNRVISAIKRLEEPMPSQQEIAQMEKVLEKIFLKIHPAFTQKSSKKNDTLIKKACEYFENGRLKSLEILNVMLPELPPVKKEDIAQYSKNITAQLRRNIKAVKAIQQAYPYNKIPVMTDKNTLREKQKEAEALIKKEQNHMYSLEKTLDSLF